MKECDICGNEMYDYNNGAECIGMTIDLTGKHSEIDRVKEMFGKTNFAICFCCWLKSLGVKPLNGYYYISIKDKDGQFVHHKVKEEVYYYIKQLEAYIKFPELSTLKEFYPERFSK
jgi:hypothetical protein